MSIHTRTMYPFDYRKTEELIRSAFWNHHAPGCDEHYLAHILWNDPAFLSELSMVAEDGEELVGQILYTKAKLILDGGGEETVPTFGPISVSPERQGEGIGSRLVTVSMAHARAMGYGAVLIYGDPAFYHRFGFLPAEEYSIGSHDNFYADALQAREIIPGFLTGKAGRFQEAPAFQVDAAAAQAYDEGFPKLEKITGGPSQERFLELVAKRKPR